MDVASNAWRGRNLMERGVKRECTERSPDGCRFAFCPIDEALLLMQELPNWQDDEGISMSKALFATPDACRSKDER